MEIGVGFSNLGWRLILIISKVKSIICYKVLPVDSTRIIVTGMVKYLQIIPQLGSLKVVLIVFEFIRSRFNTGAENLPVQINILYRSGKY